MILIVYDYFGQHQCFKNLLHLSVLLHYWPCFMQSVVWSGFALQLLFCQSIDIKTVLVFCLSGPIQCSSGIKFHLLLSAFVMAWLASCLHNFWCSYFNCLLLVSLFTHVQILRLSNDISCCTFCNLCWWLIQICCILILFCSALVEPFLFVLYVFSSLFLSWIICLCHMPLTIWMELDNCFEVNRALKQ